MGQHHLPQRVKPEVETLEFATQQEAEEARTRVREGFNGLPVHAEILEQTDPSKVVLQITAVDRSMLETVLARAQNLPPPPVSLPDMGMEDMDTTTA
jgi:hypothetical protein